jgi:DNA polymerase-1
MENVKIGLLMRQRGVLIDENAREAHRGPMKIKEKWARNRLRVLAKRRGFQYVKEKPRTEWDYEERVSKKGVVRRVRIKDSKRIVYDKTEIPFDPVNIHHIRKLFKECYGIQGGKPKREGGEESYDAKVMEELSKHPDRGVRILASKVLNFRQWNKLISTYIDGLPVYGDGKIHVEWKPGNTSTLRWASSNPNGQNAPKFLRDMFTPHLRDLKEKLKGVEVGPRLTGVDDKPYVWQHFYLVSADYSQLELRIVALLAGDEVLLDAYARGIDVHALNAEAIFGEAWKVGNAEVRKELRDFAKRFVYGANYGASAKTLWANLVPDFPKLKLSTVERALAAWFAAHPKIKLWQERVLRDAHLRGYVEEPASGHRVYFFGNVDPSVALNFPVQTFAAWIMNQAAVEVSAALDWKGGEGILFQIHDDLTIAVRDWRHGAAILKAAMEKVRELAGAKVAFPIDISVSFDDAYHKMEIKPDGTLKAVKHDDPSAMQRQFWLDVEAAGFWHQEAA